MRKTILYFLFLISIFSTAQSFKVGAVLDTQRIRIGEQVKLKLILEKNKNEDIQFPSIKDTLSAKVEVVYDAGIDTVIENDRQKLSRILTLTSFDSGRHVIPSFLFLKKGNKEAVTDSVFTNATFLEVFTIPVDTAQASVKDVKKPLDTPFILEEIYDILGYSLLGILVLLILFFVWKKVLNKPKEILEQKVVEAPHIIALRELEKLKETKLWQLGRNKEFHSRITEIVRLYIEGKFQIQALEQTSDEVLTAFRKRDLLSQKQYGALRQMLLLADQVKFAKAEPLPDENLISMDNSYLFIQDTINFNLMQKDELESKKVDAGFTQNKEGNA